MANLKSEEFLYLLRNRGAGYHDDANNAMLAMWRVEKEDFVSFHSI
ncbi:hypothetical protein [Psychrobacillus sp. NPDC093200]